MRMNLFHDAGGRRTLRDVGRYTRAYRRLHASGSCIVCTREVPSYGLVPRRLDDVLLWTPDELAVFAGALRMDRGGVDDVSLMIWPVISGGVEFTHELATYVEHCVFQAGARRVVLDIEGVFTEHAPIHSDWLESGNTNREARRECAGYFVECLRAAFRTSGVNVQILGTTYPYLLGYAADLFRGLDGWVLQVYSQQDPDRGMTWDQLGPGTHAGSMQSVGRAKFDEHVGEGEYHAALAAYRQEFPGRSVELGIDRAVEGVIHTRAEEMWVWSLRNLLVRSRDVYRDRFSHWASRPELVDRIAA